MNACRLFLTIAVVLSASFALAVPPHPEILQKIRTGEIPEPIFISNPSYMASMGIDQGRKEPLFEPGMSLVNANFLVMLVGFSDQSGVTTPAYFDSMVFGAGIGPYGPSLRNFYSRASYGNLTIVTVNPPSSTSWQTAPFNRFYYTEQGGAGSVGMGLYPNNSQGLAEWLVNTIDPMVNFANYDNNSDGVVDGIIIVHSGRGFETSGNVLDIASHSWGLLNALWKDGVWVSSYCMVPEYRYNVSPNDNTVGVLSHEFGHILGLPDLYDTGYDSNGLGKWSLMAWGVYNGNRGGTDTLSGVSPAFLDAWSRVFLGYVTPVNVTCFLNNQMILPVEDTAMVFRLWNNGNMGPEYFLVENRNTTYTDTALATYGLLIYHVDENQPNNDNQWWPGQPPANHYKVALEQADGAYDLERNVNRMDFWDPFNGGAFDYSSSPSSRDYYNNPTNVSITEILGGGVGMADLDVGGTAPPGVPIISYPDDGYATNYVLLGGGWYVVPCASRYGIQFDDDISFSSPVVDDTTLAYNYYSYSFLHQPDGIYYWRVKAGNSAGWSGWSEVRSQFLDRQIPYGTIASSPDTAHSSSFTVSWTAGIDPPPSSGICSYSVICDSGAGPAWYWQLNVQGQSAVFTEARNGNTYLFCAMAHDCALNQELWNWQFECTTYVEISGCAYRIGDINNVAPANGIDVTYGVSYLKGGNPPPVNCSPPCPQPAPFYAAMDVNGTCNTNGIDITYFVGFLKGGPALMFCPTCPPAGRVAGGSIDAGDY